MAERDAQIEEFINITGVDKERAEFYLSSTGGQLQLALSSFFEDHDDEPPPTPAGPDQAGTSSSGSSQAAPAAVTFAKSPPPKQQPASSGNRGRVATFASIQRGHPSSSDSEEEGQAYYAGGSEESGQQIIGPSKKKSQKADEVVESLFKSAKERGAEVVEPSDAAAEHRRRAAARANLFAGAGYRLGESESERSEMIPSTSSSSKKVTDVVLRLWKTGFTVNDGPLREYANPENSEFLSSIQKGELPKELVHQARGGEVSLDMEDHRNEDYVPPKVQIKAFSGHGQMLGSPAPQVVVAAVTAVASSAPSASQPKPDAISPHVDETKPTTSLQIRLADGTRLTAKFNLSHTVDDVRKYVKSARPQNAARAFALLTTFPNKELVDGTVTLKDANLQNAVIVQKML